MSSQPQQVPRRWALAFLATVHALIFGWGASVLPWDGMATFAIALWILAVGHGATAASTLARSRHADTVWRWASVASLVFLAWQTYALWTSVAYVAALYGSLGEGIGAAVMAGWGLLVLLTVPVAAWGIAATGGIRAPKRAAGGAAALALLFQVGSCRAAAAAEVDALPGSEVDPSSFRAALAAELEGDWEALESPDGRRSLYDVEAVTCPDAAFSGTDAAAVITYWDPTVDAPAHACIVAPPGGLAGAVAETIRTSAGRSYVKIDILSGRGPISADRPVLDGLKLRPAADGICHEGRCLMPWQLVARDSFTKHTPLKFIPDLRIGFSPNQLGAALGREEDLGVEGLDRLETHSLLVTPRGNVLRLPRLHEVQPRVNDKRVRKAVGLAETHIAAAQVKTGKFRYKLDPFTGKMDLKGFNLPRQAGTTLVFCELGRDAKRTRKVAQRSLKKMARHARAHGDASFLTKGSKAKAAQIGSTALPLIAFMQCRDVVGHAHDELIGRMARGLLSLQRDDGGFHPAFDRRADAPKEGPDALYAAGQAIFALSLVEKAVEVDPSEHFPSKQVLHDAVERAMNQVAGPYWDHALGQFFYIEENWHCLAARASLGHHRNEAYERFCLDYVTFKKRLILDEDSGVEAEYVGGYGFGNIVPPYNTGTSGFVEALVASIEIARARGENTATDEETLRSAMQFLLRQQWLDSTCFACRTDRPVLGGWSESLASPVIRIDFVQHAWAALGHGGRVLGLLEAPSWRSG